MAYALKEYSELMSINREDLDKKIKSKLTMILLPSEITGNYMIVQNLVETLYIGLSYINNPPTYRIYG
ncbi:MAG: hypothetical protein B6U75_04535 [Desulfurococcales archaeon ex4484_217_1]|nr:MAG: hypothetical protein B6U75_04535 [Desulfurococcales archaeon ex4484_217_1]